MGHLLKTMADDLFRSVKCRLKFSEDEYSIFLTDQFRKPNVSEFISTYYDDVRIVTVSGTMRKCKKVMAEDVMKSREAVSTVR